jgi:MYXO-CTERM domain-containing protein
MWDQLLDRGHKLGVVGGSDDHRAGMATGVTASPIGSPTTLVLADGLSEAAIVEAVRAGRTVVQLRGPDDPIVEMTIGTAELGDTVDDVAKVTVTARIQGGDGTTAQLWRDGVKIAEKPVRGASFTTTFDDRPGAQARRYRIEVINDLSQRVVVTSHIYVNGIEDGCGCTTRSPRGGWLIGLALLALRRRRR